MATLSEAAVLDALKTVIDPDLKRDIVTLKFVKNIRLENGRVSLTIERATHGGPGRDQVRDEAHQRIAALPGTPAVEILMTAHVRATVSSDVNRQPVPGV